MSKDLQLFLKDELYLIEKFYKLMDILISNQQNYKFEPFFFSWIKLSSNIVNILFRTSTSF